MANAVIYIDDGGGALPGTQDRAFAFLGVTFTFSNFSDTGVLAWEWTLKDKPIGSAAALTSTSGSTTQLTPDVEGTYLVQLNVYTDAGATELADTDVEAVGVRFDVPYDWRVPAAGETIQFDAARGWAQAREEAIRDVWAFLNAGGGSDARRWASTAHAIANATAVDKRIIFYDANGGTFTIFAPAAPTAGMVWALSNEHATDATAITVSGNGATIENPLTATVVASFLFGAQLATIEYVYTGSFWKVV